MHHENDEVLLYYPVSLVSEIRGVGRAAITWFKRNGRIPIADPEHLVLNHESLSDSERHTALAILREALTKAEVADLKAYLEKSHGWKVLPVAVPLPFMSIRETPNGHREAVLPYGSHDEGEDRGFYRLNEEAGYDLSVPIWGYYVGTR